MQGTVLMNSLWSWTCSSLPPVPRDWDAHGPVVYQLAGRSGGPDSARIEGRRLRRNMSPREGADLITTHWTDIARTPWAGGRAPLTILAGRLPMGRIVASDTALGSEDAVMACQF